MAQFVRDMRDAAGLTQVELAERLGRRQSWVSRVEDGKLPLKVLDMVTISEACGLTLDISTTHADPAGAGVDPAPLP